jgi:hypothetical protein
VLSACGDSESRRGSIIVERASVIRGSERIGDPRINELVSMYRESIVRVAVTEVLHGGCSVGVETERAHSDEAR